MHSHASPASFCLSRLTSHSSNGISAIRRNVTFFSAFGWFCVQPELQLAVPPIRDLVAPLQCPVGGGKEAGEQQSG